MITCKTGEKVTYMEKVENSVSRAVVFFTEKEESALLDFMKKEGIYRPEEPISWNVKNLLFHSAGIEGKPLTAAEKRKERNRDIRRKAKAFDTLAKNSKNI